MKRYLSLLFVVLIGLTSLFSAVVPAASVHAATYQATVLELNRRAAQQLEDLRSSGMALKWNTATLGKRQLLYRPDLRAPAYYEYAVMQGTTPAGFIILSTGLHDFPVAHWNDAGDSPTANLMRQAAALNQTVTRFYKLDALTYAAENSAGELIALYPPKSRLPTSISGQDPSMLDQKMVLSHETWTATTKDENGAPRHTRSQSGPLPTGKITLGGWSSWKEFKAGFTQSYQTMLQSLARQAKHDWDIDAAAAKSGEGLVAGRECKVVATLYAKFTIALRGTGIKYVSATARQRTGLLPVIDVCTLGAPSEEGLRVDLAITYSNEITEVLPFAVLSESFADNNPQTGARTGISAPNADAPQDAWGPWTYYWAGNSAAQRYYTQIDAHTFNNTTDCYSGCGATAWAMLFGWADNQAASGNAYWAPRWGIYRVNGGTGADAIAPASMDAGVRAMTTNIRNRIGTFCAFGSGATPPWDMDGAAGYLNGRSGTRVSTHYDVLGISEDRLREYARNSIRDRGTPAIIGTGWLTHYPLAYGYAWQSRTVNVLWWTETEYNRWFYVNQGWGGSGDGWVSASTWFAGEITP